MRNYVVGAASAVEQQSAVTQEMSSKMQDASQAVTRIAANIGTIWAAVGKVSQTLDMTKNAARVLARQKLARPGAAS